MKAEDHIKNEDTLFWFRRDLRLDDNAGLFHALKENPSVLPIFIFDTEILDKLEDKADKRVEFIFQSLITLKSQLEEIGTSLLVLHGSPAELFARLSPKNIYANHDYEPYGRFRDEQVNAILRTRGIQFKTFKDHVIFEKNEIVKDDRTPYTVFTPYCRKWKMSLTLSQIKGYDIPGYSSNFKRIAPLSMPELAAMGFQETGHSFPGRNIKRSILREYHLKRNFPGINGTTRVSVHLRFGTVSIRKAVQEALETNEVWLNELIWREFYHMILWNFPTPEKAFKPAYDNIKWRNDPQEFQAWCQGKTGYPIVDAGMRELAHSGFMHNRVRMIVASFLTKHLLIDWRWGEAYFAQKLLDFDLAANNGGWQWASGSGCDAAPYFRIFNPDLQTRKFDARSEYLKNWLPELGTPEYSDPIVDHNFARARALMEYKRALSHA